MRLQRVDIRPLTAERLRPIIGPERAKRFDAAAQATRALLNGRAVHNVNSTAAGGGVAEMLQALLAYALGAGIDVRWLVINGDPEFFNITKRIHNHLYGSAGDRGPLGTAERAHYEQVTAANAEEVVVELDPGDVVVLHDPQTAGLAPVVRAAGFDVVWRCHVGSDVTNAYTERGWDFLRPYLEQHVEAFVFSRGAFAPAWADPARTHVIPPSIDPFSPKNEELSPATVRGILGHVGLVEDAGSPAPPTFVRHDGSQGRVHGRVEMRSTGPPPPLDAPLVVQVSRWDHIKDMAGVMTAFASYVAGHVNDAHLALIGPSVTGVADDPEAIEVLAECTDQWRALPEAVRSRIHLACLPMQDLDENAAIVNAAQRHAAVVTQKSIAEGFGLTVVEAMLKSRPVVATAVGGISDQIVSGENGLLVDDPHDLVAFGDAVRTLLTDPALAARLGANARERAVSEFLGDRHLVQWGTLLAGLEGVRPG